MSTVSGFKFPITCWVSMNVMNHERPPLASASVRVTSGDPQASVWISDICMVGLKKSNPVAFALKLIMPVDDPCLLTTATIWVHI